MSFLNSAFLLALPLASIPLLIHLFNRRRKKTIQWGAMRFLLEATSRRKRLWRVSDLLLLLLRLAAVILFILAIAQPLLRNSWFGSPTGVREMVLIIDQSLSTAQRKDESAETMFDRQISLAKDLVERLGEGDVVRVLLAGEFPIWLSPTGIVLNADSRREILARLGELSPTLSSANMMRCVREAIEAPAALSHGLRSIVVLTDGQAYGWQAAAVQAWKTLNQLRLEAALPSSFRVVSVGDAENEAANLSVEKIESFPAVAGPEESVQISATVRNRGGGGEGQGSLSKATLLEWRQEGDSLGVSTVGELAPGESTVVKIETVFDSPGLFEVECALVDSDPLLLDNSAKLSVEVVEEVPFLMVTPTGEENGLEAICLLTALGRFDLSGEEQWRSIFRPTRIEVSEVSSVELSDYRCVVLADIGEAPTDWIEDLYRYVQEGGGLWILLGERTDPNFFNSAFVESGRSLSPLPLDEPTGEVFDPDRFERASPPSSSHPATRLLADTQRLDIDQVQIYRRHRFRSDGGAQPTGTVLAMAGGEPLAIENAVGEGRVLIQTIPLSAKWSNLASSQAYVVMVGEWLRYLTEPTTPRWNLARNEAFFLRLPADEFDPEGFVITPEGRSIDLASETRNNERLFTFPKTQTPGNYQLVTGGARGATHRFGFQVLRDVEESDLAPLSQAARDTLKVAAGAEFVEDPLIETGEITATVAPTPIWNALLTILLALMFFEMLLAGWMNLGVPARTPTPTLTPKTEKT